MSVKTHKKHGSDQNMEKRTLYKQKHVKINYDAVEILILALIIGVSLAMLGLSEDPNIYAFLA